MSQKNTYNAKIYQNVPIRHLVVFGIYSVISRGEECTFEKLVAECFNLFPKIFSLARYPNWPDSLQVDNQLRALRKNGFIKGHPRGTYELTKFGTKLAEETKKILGETTLITQKIEKVQRDSDINLINFFKHHEVYQRFLNNSTKFTMSEMELRNFLHCTLETPLRIVKQNFAYAQKIAREFKEMELIKFLDLCQREIINKK
jgi:hypothetical protein